VSARVSLPVGAVEAVSRFPGNSLTKAITRNKDPLHPLAPEQEGRDRPRAGHVAISTRVTSWLHFQMLNFNRHVFV
jgi:hypothetical protein